MNISRFILLIFAALFCQLSFADVCSKSSSMKIRLQKVIGKPCSEITQNDLLNVTELVFGSERDTDLRPGDFDGLSNLKTTRVLWKSEDSIPEGLFANITSLESLSYYMGTYRLDTVPQNLLKTLPNLKEFTFAKNGYLRNLNDDFFSKNPLLEKIYLSVEELPKNIFMNLAHLREIDISECELENFEVDLFGLNELETIRLNKNNLAYVNPKIFAILPGLKQLDLSDNELSNSNKQQLRQALGSKVILE